MIDLEGRKMKPETKLVWKTFGSGRIKVTLQTSYVFAHVLEDKDDTITLIYPSEARRLIRLLTQALDWHEGRLRK